VRLRNDACATRFKDLHYGLCETTIQIQTEDPVMRRADGQFTYNLAVVADDIEQGIDLVVRGADLLEMTPLHQMLFSLFEAPVPDFLHTPMAVHKPGVKYAKQSYSPAIDTNFALQNVKACLVFMGGEAKHIADFATVDDCLQWGIEHWTMDMMTTDKEIVVTQTNGVYSVLQ